MKRNQPIDSINITSQEFRTSYIIVLGEGPHRSYGGKLKYRDPHQCLEELTFKLSPSFCVLNIIVFELLFPNHQCEALLMELLRKSIPGI